MSMDKDVATIIRSAAKQGWEINHGTRHLILQPPDPSKPRIAVSKSSLGSAKAFKTFRSKMRNGGWRG